MIKAFRIITKQHLPMFNIEQVGISESAEFQLSDPSLYFTGHPHSDSQHIFSEWMGNMVKEILELPLDLEKHE